MGTSTGRYISIIGHGVSIAVILVEEKMKNMFSVAQTLLVALSVAE